MNQDPTSNQNHLSEDELIMTYYGEPASAKARQHIEECAECRAEFARLSQALGHVSITEVPQLAEDYEQQVWMKLRDRLPERRLSFWEAWFRPQRLAFAGAALAIILVAFSAGLWWASHGKPAPLVQKETPAAPGHDRIIIVAVGSHLEQSQMLLVEMLTTSDEKGKTDISLQQEQARDLLQANRLYRVSAAKSGDPAVQRTLEDLERVLIEIANSPSQIDNRSVEQLQRAIQGQDLLFRVRVVGSKLRQESRESEPQSSSKTQRM